MSDLHMTIPQIRSRMYELADEYGFDELRELADQTRRRSPVRRTRNSYPPLTPELAETIRAHAAANPAHGYKRMSEDLDVNIGRISEALAGKRGA